MIKYVIPIAAGAYTALAACTTYDTKTAVQQSQDSTIQPAIVTEAVAYDSDDPAIWINPANPAQSLIIGTDKSEDGALYVFNLQGKIQQDKVVKGLKRPNNVDIAYGLPLLGKPTDIAVATERLNSKLRIFSVPGMQPVDQGGIPVFSGEQPEDNHAPMGVALYKNKKGQQYAIVGRKSGPSGSYLWQYLLEDDGAGHVKASLVRKFGQYSGGKEIEAIAVDQQLGYIYYSDEGKGVRKYFADPEKGNQELALFATTGFTEDHEGISIYQLTDSTGYILVSDQGANKFHIFPREGANGNPHQHNPLKVVKVSANHSDGSDVVAIPLNETFRHGLFVAMSDNKTFHLYRWEDIAGKTLKMAPSR
ncbi:phytase [Chitinophaga pendula]|uniref:phytase n=1 Tax=Chitinophaga TaxID=79328 RepID=UPI000BAF63DA|nr:MULTISPECIES: phytase [Chitinophaga]ASZ12986.1 3-phytase [Chitinophaga sp. MD30]UCJ09381.1 phytase [Chitinophaga pendula]